MVKDIVPGPDGSRPDRLTDVGGTLYFRAWDGTHGRELWMSDGTEAGTTLVTDLFPGEMGSEPRWITDFAEGAFFSARTPLTGRELWRIVQ